MNSTLNLPPNLKEKIEKLLALADPERGATPAECNLASAKIQDLLARHNLELHQVLGEQTPQNQLVQYQESFENWLGKNDGLWAQFLLGGIAQLNGVDMIVLPNREYKHKSRYLLVGKKHSIEISVFMVDSIVNRGKILEKKSWASYRGSVKRGQFRRSFYEGLTDAVLVKLRDQAQQFKQSTPEYGLMVKSDFEKAREKMSELFPNVKTQKVRGSGGMDGRGLGWEAGKNLDMQKGVSSQKTSHTLLN